MQWLASKNLMTTARELLEKARRKKSSETKKPVQGSTQEKRNCARLQFSKKGKKNGEKAKETRDEIASEREENKKGFGNQPDRVHGRLFTITRLVGQRRRRLREKRYKTKKKTPERVEVWHQEFSDTGFRDTISRRGAAQMC